MNMTTVIGLVNNAGLLLGLGLLCDMIPLDRKSEKPLVQVLAGLLLGVIGVAVMMNPWHFSPGVIFDTRSVLLSVGGLFFGSVPTLVAVLITGGYRLYLAGNGMWMGVAVIVLSGGIGSAWRRLRHGAVETISAFELYTMGILVHIFMLVSLYLLLPSADAAAAFPRVGLPVMIVYPVGTVLLGKLIGTRLQHKRDAEALRESKQKYQLLVENQTDLVVEVDMADRFQFVSPSYCRLFGKSEDELLGQSFVPMIHEDDRLRTAEALQDIYHPPHTVYIEQRAMTELGWRWLGWMDTAVLDDDQRVTAIIGVGRDITERVAAENESREINRRLAETLAELRETQEQMMQQERLAAVGRLSAGIAHDFNNILAAVVLYTHLSLRENGLSPKVRKHLQVIAGQANRAADLVQQILDFGRQALIERQPLALDVFLGEVLELLARTLPESIRIDLEVGPGPFVVSADSTRVQQAIVNLALNARDAMPDGGELHMELSRVAGAELVLADFDRPPDGEWIKLTVQDTGSGISPEVLPHIFEPFYTTKMPRGHGLGLAQVYGIMKQHEGHIEVGGEAGQGTMFKLYWPPAEVLGGQALSQPQVEAAKGNGQTILVVEDNAIIRAALMDVVELLGYRVLEAVDGREALAVCDQRQGDIALVLSDWVMPVMGGRELARALAARHATLKVLMLTGHALSEDTKRAVPETVIGWVLKPVNLEQLADALARALPVD